LQVAQFSAEKPILAIRVAPSMGTPLREESPDKERTFNKGLDDGSYLPTTAQNTSICTRKKSGKRVN
jgi:hypothetical protein